MLAYITGSVDEELLLRNEYRVTENRILRGQLQGRLRLSDPERISLAKIGKQLGRKVLGEVAQIVRPETILGWHRRLVAKKFHGSRERGAAKLAPKAEAIEEWVLELAGENRSWGYRRLAPPSRGTEQLRTAGESSNRGQYPEAARHGPGPGTGQQHGLGRVRKSWLRWTSLGSRSGPLLG
jgi:hypothetical protein